MRFDPKTLSGSTVTRREYLLVTILKKAWCCVWSGFWQARSYDAGAQTAAMALSTCVSIYPGFCVFFILLCPAGAVQYVDVRQLVDNYRTCVWYAFEFVMDCRLSFSLKGMKMSPSTVVVTTSVARNTESCSNPDIFADLQWLRTSSQWYAPS